MSPFIKRSILKKKCCKILQKPAISYLEILKIKGDTEKELKYFTIDSRKATNLGKLHLLPKIHKRLFEVPDRPVISNCSTPTEKVSEFMDSELKLVMQESWSNIKDSSDFIKSLKNIDHIPYSA